MVSIKSMPNELAQQLVAQMLPTALHALPFEEYPKYDSTAKHGYHAVEMADKLFRALYERKPAKQQLQIMRELVSPLLREMHYAGVTLNVFVFTRNNKQFYYDPESGNMYAVLETGQLAKVPSK